GPGYSLRLRLAGRAAAPLRPAAPEFGEHDPAPRRPAARHAVLLRRVSGLASRGGLLEPQGHRGEPAARAGGKTARAADDRDPADGDRRPGTRLGALPDAGGRADLARARLLPGRVPHALAPALREGGGAGARGRAGALRARAGLASRVAQVPRAPLARPSRGALRGGRAARLGLRRGVANAVGARDRARADPRSPCGGRARAARRSLAGGGDA